MTKILLADSDRNVCSMIRRCAEAYGYMIEEAFDGVTAAALCRLGHFDLIIIDTGLSGRDGFTVCRELRTYKSTPVIMLSSEDGEAGILSGFEAGADDYIIKPFSSGELMARINAVLRRASLCREQLFSIYEFGGLTVNRISRSITVDGKETSLSPKLFALLLCLVENSNTVFTREQLLTRLWGEDYYGYDRTVDTHIKLLRSKLGRYRHHIITVHGTGYKFKA